MYYFMKLAHLDGRNIVGHTNSNNIEHLVSLLCKYGWFGIEYREANEDDKENIRKGLLRQILPRR